MIYSCRTKPLQKEQIRHGAKSNGVTVIKEAKCVSVRSGAEHDNSKQISSLGIPEFAGERHSVSGTILAISRQRRFSQLAGAFAPTADTLYQVLQ